MPLAAKQVRFDDQTGLSASKWGFVPDLDLLASFLHDLHHENDVSGMVPGGLNGRVPVPPEKRFLIHQYEFKGRITDEILQNIVTARVVIAECSAANKNVFFEVGFALGRGRGKDVVLLVDEATNIPFDLKDFKFLVHHKSIDTLKEQLRKRIRFLLGIDQETKEVLRGTIEGRENASRNTP